jgi:hypothetical protein
MKDYLKLTNSLQTPTIDNFLSCNNTLIQIIVIHMCITMARMKWNILQQHKESTLTHEKNIFVLEAHNTLFVPQTIGIGNVTMWN